MRTKLNQIIFLLTLTMASCAPATNSPVPTATLYSPVAQHTPIPLVYEPITPENAESVTLLARWKIDTRAENVMFAQNTDELCVDNKGNIQNWNIYNGVITQSATTCPTSPFINSAFGAASISPDNIYSAYAGSESLSIYDTLSPETYLFYHLKRAVNSVGFSSSGEYLAVGFQNGDVWFIPKSEWVNGSNFVEIKPDIIINVGKAPLQILFSPGDSMLAFLFSDQTIQLWSVPEFSLYSTINTLISPGRIYKIAFSPNKNIIVTGSSDNYLRLWDVRTGKLLAKLEGLQESGFINSIAFSPTSRILVSLHSSVWIYVWGILPDNLTKAEVNSTEMAESPLISTTPTSAIPTPTLTPTSSLPSYQGQAPLNWPVSMPTTNQILEARNCDIEALAKSRYHEELSYWGFEGAYPLRTPCDWATLAFAYQSRIEKRDAISEEGKRAFFQAVQHNPALAMNEALLYPYFDSFDLVDAPPLAGQPITSITIDYEWSGIGEPSHLEYDIEIENTRLSSDEVKISVMSQPEELKNNLSDSLNHEKIQEIGNSLTDFLPVQVPFTLEPCTDNSPDWNITVNFLNGKSITLTTHHSNLLTAGGPWFMELDGQFYIQFSSALTQAILSLFDSLGLPLGQPYSMFCSHTNTIELAFP